MTFSNFSYVQEYRYQSLAVLYMHALESAWKLGQPRISVHLKHSRFADPAVEETRISGCKGGTATMDIEPITHIGQRMPVLRGLKREDLACGRESQQSRRQSSLRLKGDRDALNFSYLST